MNNFSPIRYWQALRVQLSLILLSSLLMAVGVYAALNRLPVTHEVHYSYLVSLATREEAADYSFDGYYALQATDLFAETVAEWVTSPEVVVAAYEAVQLPIPSRQTRQLVGHVVAAKAAPQLVEITIKESTPERAEKITAGLQTVMQRNLDDYHQQGIPALTFRLVATKPWASEQRLETSVIALATFVLIFFAGVNVALLRESWQAA